MELIFKARWWDYSDKNFNIDALKQRCAGRMMSFIEPVIAKFMHDNKITYFVASESDKLIVLDATTGQNAVQQVDVFNEAIDIDGIILTKLDGTAKGGIEDPSLENVFS